MAEPKGFAIFYYIHAASVLNRVSVETQNYPPDYTMVQYLSYNRFEHKLEKACRRFL